MAGSGILISIGFICIIVLFYTITSISIDDNGIEISLFTASEKQVKTAFEYLNQLRTENKVQIIKWDDQIYKLAEYKVMDMYEKNYFNHPDPEGQCIGNYASEFGLKHPANTFADNIFKGSNSPMEAINVWMDSDGHRFNLLYPYHSQGALACGYGYCVFIGQGYSLDGSYWDCVAKFVRMQEIKKMYNNK